MERSQDERDALRELAALLPREERDIMIQPTYAHAYIIKFFLGPLVNLVAWVQIRHYKPALR